MIIYKAGLLVLWHILIDVCQSLPVLCSCVVHFYINTSKEMFWKHVIHLRSHFSKLTWNPVLRFTSAFKSRWVSLVFSSSNAVFCHREPWPTSSRYPTIGPLGVVIVFTCRLSPPPWSAAAAAVLLLTFPLLFCVPPGSTYRACALHLT